MPARYTVLSTKDAQINQSQFKPIWKEVIRGVNAAFISATNQGPEYLRWFGGNAARNDIVIEKMTQFTTFMNGHNSVIIQPRVFNPTANDYAHVYQMSHSSVGQWIVYLGPAFNHAPSAWSAANMAHPGLQGHQVLTIAHELSHVIMSTNKPPQYSQEHYEENALTLAGADPEYAAWNADNYGFFVEACT